VAAFYCEKTFYLANGDSFVMAGRMVSGTVHEGMAVDLPRELRGPGWVPIAGAQTVPFDDGRALLCLLIDYAIIAGSPFMEFGDLHGKTLDVRSERS